jgi:DNA-binding response OmpR family regulator
LSDNDSKAVAFGAGADDYLTKPYQPNDLRAMIKNLAGQNGQADGAGSR